MFALRDLLTTVPAERPLWSGAGGDTLSAADLSALLQATQSSVDSLRGGSVAVFAEQAIDLAKLLLVLDGVCPQITLLPASKDIGLLQSIARESDSEIVVTATDSLIAQQLGARRIELDSGLPSTAETKEGVSTPSVNTRWVLPTSGTTGPPKLVAHTLRSLTRSVRGDLERGSRFVWGSLYSLHSFAGLQVFLQSWFGGSRLLLGRDDAALAQRLDELIRGGCNALSATPTMWRMLLMLPGIGELKLEQITLGGEAADQRVLDVLRATFPSTNITQVYASTEAGVGFTVRDGLAGFPAAFLDDPAMGLRMNVDDSGRLWLGHAEAEQAYLDPKLYLRDDHGLIDTGDIVRRENDRFVFLGRANGLINVGGRKVHPHEVESVLLGCPGVQLARALARSNPFTGSLVEAEVVAESLTAEAEEGLEAKVIEYCRQHLEPYKVPAIVRVVNSFALTPSGKVVRRGS